MPYTVRSLVEVRMPLTPLGLQAFLNGWVRAEGYELVDVVVLEGDWLVVLKK
jgi:hypothetical protein